MQNVVNASARSIDLRQRLVEVFRRPDSGAAAGTLLVFAVFSVTAGDTGFLTQAGTASWLNLAAELGIIALPIGLLMIAGEFDLSVGSNLAASSMVLAITQSRWDLPLAAGVLITLAFGLAVGLLNGLLVTRSGLPSFIVTLVSLFSLAGASLGLSRIIAGTTSISLRTSGVFHDLFAKQIGGFNVSILWWAALTFAAYWVLSQARFGSWILAVGGDADSARLTGVPINRVKMRLYLASGLCASLLGVVQALEFQNADVTRGQSFVFQTIVAAVVGGCLLAGGYGSAIGISLGAMTYAIVSLGVFYTGWSTDWVQLFVGVLLLLAVLGNNLVQRLALTRI
ncbi:ABC transporter permease [Actinomadura graeca]|uniref:Xylose transport system permease protein XylH n=1 Tax=Actinomadura graeca TaxID=2750812 RepID=A0ABX8QZ26_9ACTN|nr:ABC transporter permease [Actinomadura graeca]QXJ23868.1 ABC transporter permease [Actinomadura graeca]